MSQTLFGDKGTIVPPKCIYCGITLGNYSDWYEGEGPLCHICYSKRIKGVDIPRGNVNVS